MESEQFVALGPDLLRKLSCWCEHHCRNFPLAPARLCFSTWMTTLRSSGGNWSARSMAGMRKVLVLPALLVSFHDSNSAATRASLRFDNNVPPFQQMG